ncbi:sialate O-acetylesterase [Flagellimonas marina]|uniref:Sialate O-acetylesterase n=1 Tax=Flagellimonas marina TaxID=1775168 RepID=A0ABV8PTQ2_9FLAO
MRNRILRVLFFCLVLCFNDHQVQAQVDLPSIFGSNMVLQRNTDVSIWGKGSAKNEITVTTSWNGKAYETKTDKEGNWKLKVKTPEAGGPYQVNIADGDETVILENVLIGEVWICSGQSNMEWELIKTGTPTFPSPNNLVLESSNPSIRLLNIEHNMSYVAQSDFTGLWKECGPESSGNFSAVGYYFGKMLFESLNVPIGLISSNWGGTRIQAWIDEQGLRSFDPSILDDRSKGDNQNRSCVLFNAMINPMLDFKIRGVIWYQGESNTREAKIYDDLMEIMVSRWRERWGIGEFPFYYCQLAPFDYNRPAINSAFLREAQYEASKRIPNSGMVSLMDSGEEKNVHPNNKEIAGQRLAYFALKETYGVKGIVCKGPELDKITINGSEVNLTFKYDDGGLTNYGNGFNLFELAGEDKRFYPASAKYNKKTKIMELSCPNVSKPIAVRYAFKDFVVGDIFNRYGIPASSFRTDGWEDE